METKINSHRGKFEPKKLMYNHRANLSWRKIQYSYMQLTVRTPVWIISVKETTNETEW